MGSKSIKGMRTKSLSLLLCIGALSCAPLSARAEEATGQPKREALPTVINSYMDFGQVVKGNSPENGTKLEMTLLQRTGVSLSKEVVVADKFNIKVGTGGIFWYVFPMLPGALHTIGVRFGPGISEAHARYTFGDPSASRSEIQFGYFGYKYNDDAVNLGEYLFRSNAYPGVLSTGGWSLMNSAAYQTLGARFTFKQANGFLNHDFLLFTEQSNYPVLSISPGYVGTVNKGGVFEFGAGVSFQHLLPAKPSQLTPKKPASTWVTMNAFPDIPASTGKIKYFGDDSATTVNLRGHTAGTPIEGLEMELMNMKDAAGNKPYQEKLFREIANPTHIVNKDDAAFVAAPTAFEETDQFRYARSKEYLTFRGIKAMARMSLDLGRALGMDEAIGPDNFKFFAEAAILGIQNQPFYYEDISKRIPVMVGVNVPTWKALDLLSLQMEYYGSDFRNSQEQSYRNNLPVWTLPQSLGPQYHDPSRNQDDNLKWSIHAKKSLIPGIRLYAQVASDHMRIIDFLSLPSNEPVFHKPSEWYYLLRLEYGI